MVTQDIRGDQPLVPFEEVYNATRRLLISIHGVLNNTAFSTKLLSHFDLMAKQYPEIDMVPLLVARPKTDDLFSTIPLILSWQLLRLSAKLFDDAEDENVDKAEYINLGTGFLFTAQEALLRLHTESVGLDRLLEILHEYHVAALKACSGQHDDLLAKSTKTWMDPETWLEIAVKKSGEIFAWATWAGACYAGFDELMMKQYHEFGNHLGVLLQIADDYNDIWGASKQDGIVSYHNNLPIVYASFVANTDEMSELVQLCEDATNGSVDSKNTLAKLLVKLGAQKYILAVGWLYKRRAIEALPTNDHALEGQKHLVNLVNNLFPALPKYPIITNQ